MSQGAAGEMLQHACAALWHDIQHLVMARTYTAYQQLEQRLTAAGRDEDALLAWLDAMLQVEQQPITRAGLRNALFHIFDFFKEQLPSDERHVWHAQILQEPKKAHGRIHELLLRFPVTPLLTSYYWRSDPWRRVWFMHGGHWWQFTFEQGPQGVSYKVCALRELSLPPVLSVAHRPWLHEQRLLVQFPTGECLFYPVLTSFGSTFAPPIGLPER